METRNSEPHNHSFERIDWSGVVLSSNWENLASIKINPESPSANIIRLTPPHERRGDGKDVPWFLPDDELAQVAQLRLKYFTANPGRVCYTEGNDPSIRGASQMLLTLQADDLARSFPEKYETVRQNFSSIPRGTHPLAISGLLAQSDICLVEERGPTEHILVAGFVATPTDWELSKFIGKDMDFVHARFPGYLEPIEGRSARLKDAVDKSLNRLKPYPGLQFGRNNGFLTQNPMLADVPGEQPNLNPNDIIDPGNEIYLRTERETLTRLPAPFDKYIVFTIEPRVYRLADVALHRREDMLAALHTNQVLRIDEVLADSAIDYLKSAKSFKV